MPCLILFDIDGTLVRGGPARGAFRKALLDIFGTAGEIDGHDFSGKTDPQIARELLIGAGVENGEIDGKFPALWAAYLAILEDVLPEEPMTVLPGVRSLLEDLRDREEVILGLLTGNILEGARLKLESAGLAHFFSDVGGYGSDSEVRKDLPGVARKRATEVLGVEFPPRSVVVVGDTPRDVACGRHGGTRTVAVATGWHTVETLAGEGPDRVLEDFTDLDASLEALLEGC
jgi:phosphoglycolate phosphatase-like HAD superfamily hydrolase